MITITQNRVNCMERKLSRNYNAVIFHESHLYHYDHVNSDIGIQVCYAQV